MGKISGSSTVGTPEGLSRLEDLGLGTVDLFGVQRDGNTYKTGFYPFTICECINQEYELHLKDTYIQLNTTPDTRIISDLETFNPIIVEYSRGTKLPLIGFSGVPSMFSWNLDLSLVSDCEDAKEIDIRNNKFNMLLMLTLLYGYAPAGGGLSLPMEIKDDFQKLFAEYNFNCDGTFESARGPHFVTNRTAITDFILAVFDLGRELPDDITFFVDNRYYSSIATAMLDIDICFGKYNMKAKDLYSFYKSLNYIFLRSNEVLAYRKRETIVERITDNKYSSYTKEGNKIKIMYELIPQRPNTYLVSEGLLIV